MQSRSESPRSGLSDPGTITTSDPVTPTVSDPLGLPSDLLPAMHLLALGLTKDDDNGEGLVEGWGQGEHMLNWGPSVYCKAEPLVIWLLCRLTSNECKVVFAVLDILFT